ncbi:MAG: histidine kinase [Pseudomonadota bacterium]
MPDTVNDNLADTDSYLPDFCAGGMALAIVLLAELVAIILTLARHPVVLDFWADLARTSMFLLWIALLSTFVMCRARGWLGRFDAAGVTGASLALLVGTTAAVSEGAYWLGQFFSAPGDTVSGVFPASHQGFLLRNVTISAVVTLLMLRYFYVAHQWRRNVQMEARSRITALQARIRPHFLFNSMNTIAALIEVSPESAETAVEDLSDLFRASLDDSRQLIRIREEFETVKGYERIEKLRLGDRLQVDWQTDNVPANALVPALSIQPLLENAIYHGIEPLAEGGTISISGRRDGNNVTIEIANPVATRPRDSAHQGNRMALANIRQRLELNFGGRARMDIQHTEDHHRVTLVFPYQEAES